MCVYIHMYVYIYMNRWKKTPKAHHMKTDGLGVYHGQL